MNLNILKPISLVGIIALTLTGCATRCITVPANADTPQSFGTGFSGQLEVIQPVVRKSAGGTLEGQVEVQNKYQSSDKFEYQVQWLDKDGFKVGQPKPWTPIALYGSLRKVISYSAPSTAATDYSISFCRI